MARLEDALTVLLLGVGLVRGVVAPPRAVVLNADDATDADAVSALDWARDGAWHRLETARFTVPVSNEEARAFWINLYNALTLHAVERSGAKQSLTAHTGFFDRYAYRVSGHSFSLNDIEHGVLRANRGAFSGRTRFQRDDPRLPFVLTLEPRVHFALNCAARSCPPIRFYAAARLDEQLEVATHAYLQSARADGTTVWLPRLLGYYAADFAASPLRFARRYRPDLPAGARVRYLPYDWALEVSAFADQKNSSNSR